MTDISASFTKELIQHRASANGYTTYQAYNEFVHNAYDAGSSTFHGAVVRIPGSSKGTIIMWDSGSGTRDLRLLYGVGSNVCRKNGDGQIGLMNYGSPAAIGCMGPDRITHVSRAAGVRFASTLVFDCKNLYAAIDAVEVSGEELNYRHIDDTVLPAYFRHNPLSGLTDEVREIIQGALSAIGDTETLAPARERLLSILSNEVPSFMLTIMEFDNFLNTKAKEIVEAHRTFKMTYHPLLASERLSIEFLSDRPEECISVKVADAIDPLGPPDWSRITCLIETRLAEGLTLMKFTLSHGVESGSFWYRHVDSHSANIFKGKKYSPFTVSPPAEWSSAVKLGRGVVMKSVVLSRKLEDAQKASIGASNFSSVESLRGVWSQCNGILLGGAKYPNPTEGWGEQRNCGGIRTILSVSDKETAKVLLRLKTKKHSGEFADFHAALQTVLNWLHGVIIIPNYSHYTVCRSADGKKGHSPGVTNWKFSWFCALMMNAKAPALAPAPTPAPALSISSVSCDSDDESASVATASSSVPAAVGGAGAAPTLTPVAASMRAAPMSYRDVASRLNSLALQLVNSNLAQLAETAPTRSVKGLSTLYKKIDWLIALLQAEGGLLL